jgi:hypothetical protein
MVSNEGVTWPDAVPFDSSQGTASSAIEALLEGPGSAGPVVLVAVGPRAQRDGWAAASAILLADAFAARGESVILADLSLQNPELHELLGNDNEEGLTDVFLFGASLQHIAHAVKGKWFRLIPASGFTPDPQEVLRHQRWSGVFEELARTRSKLLVYLPVDLPGAAALADRIGHTIVLATRADFPLMVKTLSVDADVIGVLTPLQSESALQTEAPSEAAPALPEPPAALERSRDEDFEKIRIPKDSAREALIADLRARQRAALMAPLPEIVPLPFEGVPPAIEIPAVAIARQPLTAQRASRFGLEPPQARRLKGWFRWATLLLIVAALGTAAWYVWQTRFAAVDEPQPLTQPSTVERLAGVRTGAAAANNVALPYSVAIASYRDLNLAQDRLYQLGTEEPEMSFYIGPTELQGALYYRVMAGPVADSAAAVALRATLITKGIKTMATGWEILETPLAFFLGDYADRNDAVRQQQLAANKGVPTYIVATAAEDGSQQYTVYAGAYTGSGDAEFLRQILRGVGLPDNLVERTGSKRS